MPRLSTDEIAKVCHEVNAEFCRAVGDDSQVPWDRAPDWQKTSAIKGVLHHQIKPDSAPADSHNAWMADKVAGGWVYGDKKDPEAKTHPCIVPFDQLPMEQKAKDYIFRAVVKALSELT